MSGTNSMPINAGDQPTNLTESDLKQLLQRIAALEDENHNMRQQGSRLEQENQHLRTITPPLVQTATVSLPKVTLPDKYDGNRSSFRGFVNQLNLLFVLNGPRYPTDRIKIYTVGTLLTGKALAWFNPYLERPEKHTETLRSFDSFMAIFRATFGPVDPAVTAANEIRRLNQGKSSAASYAANFVQLASDLDWNDAALISQFRQGLSGEVKNMLVYHDYPLTLDQAISLAIRCDQRLLENRLDQRSRPSTSFHPSAVRMTPPPVPVGAVPMDIDVVQVSSRHPPVDEAERQRRRENNLCFRCGNPNHISKYCPLRQGKVQGQ